MSYEQDIKRKKGSVFSADDQIRMLELIEKEKDIVECKTTNKISNEDKNKAWQRIAAAYNALSVSYRTTDQLKSKYDNLKTKARKMVAEKKCYCRGTGGGEALPNNIDPVLEQVLNIVNVKTVVGLENIYDCDTENNNLMKNTEMDATNVFNILPVKPYSVALESMKICSPSIIDNPVSTKINQIEPENRNLSLCSSLSQLTDNRSTSKTEDKNWSFYTPAKLKTGVSKKLKIPNENLSIRDKYYLKKIELMEEEMRMKREEEKRKCRLLDIEIKLKEQELFTKYNINM